MNGLLWIPDVILGLWKNSCDIASSQLVMGLLGTIPISWSAWMDCLTSGWYLALTLWLSCETDVLDSNRWWSVLKPILCAIMAAECIQLYLNDSSESPLSISNKGLACNPLNSLMGGMNATRIPCCLLAESDLSGSMVLRCVTATSATLFIAISVFSCI